jgi:hypothetical protein
MGAAHPEHDHIGKEVLSQRVRGTWRHGNSRGQAAKTIFRFDSGQSANAEFFAITRSGFPGTGQLNCYESLIGNSASKRTIKNWLSYHLGVAWFNQT